MDVFRKLTLRHWAWLHFKLALLAWAIILLTYTPSSVVGALGMLVGFVAVVTIVGTAVSSVGIIMSAQGLSTRAGVTGISVELIGLCFTTAGPLSYLITQVCLAFGPEGEQRYALCLYAYAMCAALACRILIVVPRRNREAHDQTKEV